MSYEDVAAQWRADHDREARAADYRDHQEQRRARVVEDARREDEDEPPFEPIELAGAKKIAKGLWTFADKVAVRWFGPKAKLDAEEKLDLVEATAPVVQLYVPKQFGLTLSPWWGLALAVGAVYGSKWLDKDDPEKPAAAKPKKPPAPADQVVDGQVTASSEGPRRAA